MATVSQTCGLPVIDFTLKKLNSSSTSWETTSTEVTNALEQYGCFIALYDEVSQELHDAAFAASKDLLDLPVEVKVLTTGKGAAYSYVARSTKMPLFEQQSIEDVTTEQGVDKFTKLMWPSGNESFRATTLMFSKAVSRLEEMVMRMVAKTYGVEQEYEMLHGATTYTLKFNKCTYPKENQSNLGIASHTDKTFMTTIHQEKQGKGLEVQTKNGEWIQVDLSPTSFVVIAGDVCTAWSNGRIEAGNHRVMLQENKYNERFTLVLASLIRGLKVEVPQALVDEDHPLKFEAFDHYKYLEYHTKNNKIIDGERVNVSIKTYCGI